MLPSAYAPAVGGVEVLTARLAHQLLRRGHEVEVWTGRSEGDALSETELIDGIRVRRFTFTMPRAAPSSVVRFPTAALATVRRMRSAAAEFRPNILHVQCFSGNGVYATFLSRLTGTPLIVTLQGETVMDDHDIYQHSATLRLMLRLGLRRAASVTACSAFTLRDAVTRFGLDAAKSEVIFNGVDLEEIDSAEGEVPFDRYVLGLGRIVPKKGFDLLLEAFAGVSDLHPDVGLVIAGEGTERDRLQSRALELGLAERVLLPGRLNRHDVVSVMRGAEVFVMPSRVEPFGIVALEAWRAGVPIIVSSRGGAREFVEDGVSGLVVDPLDPTSLQAAIDSLLASKMLSSGLAAAGCTEVRRFEWARISDQYDALYRSVVEGGS